MYTEKGAGENGENQNGNACEFLSIKRFNNCCKHKFRQRLMFENWIANETITFGRIRFAWVGNHEIYIYIYTEMDWMRWRSEERSWFFFENAISTPNCIQCMFTETANLWTKSVTDLLCWISSLVQRMNNVKQEFQKDPMSLFGISIWPRCVVATRTHFLTSEEKKNCIMFAKKTICR